MLTRAPFFFTQMVFFSETATQECDLTAWYQCHHSCE